MCRRLKSKLLAWILSRSQSCEKATWLIAQSLVLFFPAEDGIRHLYVTGVQTCALPILATLRAIRMASNSNGRARRKPSARSSSSRSEERRVGKSVDLGGRRIIKKK